ncbi:hypothetical protein ACS2NZ_005545 [Escherichia coli]
MDEGGVYFFISRDINKLLDMFAKNNQTTIPEGGGTGASFPTRKILLWPLAGCKRCPCVHASHDFKQSVFSEKMDILLASADMDVRNQCIRTALSSLADTFFENNVNNIDMNQFRDRVHDTIVQEIQRTSKYV